MRTSSLRSGTLFLCGILFASSCVGTDVDYHDKSKSTTVLNPVADTYVNRSNASSNYGNASVSRFDGYPNEMRSLLRFSVASSEGGSIENATLRVYVTNPGNAPDVYLTSNSWSEYDVTWNNKPSPGSHITSLDGDTSTGWLEIDVSNAVTGPGEYSFYLVPQGDNGVAFHSKEGSNAPQLLLSVATEEPEGGTFSPIADTYVDEDHSSTNFGTNPLLEVDGSPKMQALLRFSLPSSIGDIESATLRLYNGDSGNGPDLYVTTDPWSENDVTWNNRPSPRGSRIASLRGNTGWQEIDVTSVVTHAGEYSFILTPAGTNGVQFHSRDGSNKPQLIINDDDPQPSSFFTIAVVPDAQYLTASESRFERFVKEMNFLVDNRDDLNLEFVISLGDMTQNGNEDDEWERAREAYDILSDAGIPFSPCQGNHDSLSSLNEYFPVSEFEGTTTWGGNRGGIENAYYLFSAGGMDFIVVVVEHYKSNNDINWANGIFERYPDRRGIFASHNIQPGSSFQDDLVTQNDNVFMAVCGHDHRSNGEEHWTDTSPSGNTQHFLFSNYQDRANKGAISRYYTFYPDRDEVCAFTYNVTEEQYEEDSHSQFCFYYDMD